MSRFPARIPNYLALGLAAAVFLAACGSDPSTGSGGQTAAAAPAAAATTGDSDQPEYGSDEFGLTLEELALRIEQVEADIGTCMTQAGFEYFPLDFDTVIEAMGLDGTAPGVSDEDYIAQFGFGFSTTVGEPDPVVAAIRGQQNQAVYDALPESDQVAYTRQLVGENEEATFPRTLEDEEFVDTGGCTREAVEQAFTEEEVSAGYFNPGDALLESDQRLVTALQEWSDCLAVEGYDYPHPDDLEDDIKDQVDAIVGEADQAALSGQAQAALTELQGFERAIAAVATSCEEDIVDPVVEQIETEIYGAPQN